MNKLIALSALCALSEYEEATGTTDHIDEAFADWLIAWVDLDDAGDDDD